MRTRGQGFVPSRELHDYVHGVMMRLLAGVPLPPSFQPEYPRSRDAGIRRRVHARRHE